MRRIAVWRWFAILTVGVVWLLGSSVWADDTIPIMEESESIEVKTDVSADSPTLDEAESQNETETDNQLEEADQFEGDNQTKPPEVEVYSPKFGDLQVIKIQLRDRNYPVDKLKNAQELIVVRNTTLEIINLNAWRLEVVSEKGIKRVEVGIDRDIVLKPGEMTYFINGYLDREFLGEVDQAGDIVVDVDGQPIFQQFEARRPKLMVWLLVNVLPVQVLPPEDEPEPPVDNQLKTPTCADGYEIGFTGTCVKVCGPGYFRNPITNRCNKIQDEVEEIKTCPEGYWLNPDTNRCNKIETPTVKTCPAGYWLNPETNRCNKIQIASALAPCPVGYERNPATNRCRKISNQQECDDGYEIGFTGTCVKTCAEGYERSPETNRCRKVVAFASDADIDGAVSATADSETTNTVRLEWYHAVLVAGGGLAIVGISKRRTITDLLKRRLGQ